MDKSLTIHWQDTETLLQSTMQVVSSDKQMP